MPEAHSLNLIFNSEIDIIGYFYHYNLDDDRTSFRKTTSTHFSSETEIHLLAMVLFLLPFHVYNIFSRAFLASNFLKTHLSDQQEEKENIEWTDARERWRRFRVPPCVFFFSAEQSLPRRRPSITRKTRLVHPGRGPRGFGFRNRRPAAAIQNLHGVDFAVRYGASGSLDLSDVRSGVAHRTIFRDRSWRVFYCFTSSL